jgi:nucleotide-binding universal stress UspA family protein
MMPYSIQNILVPVDLSQTSLNAIETAVALAKSNNASLHLIHISETYPGDSETDYSAADANADVLSAIAGAIRHSHNLTPNVIEAEGNVTDAIIKASLQIPANVIVMGTHGASGYRDGFIGSNSYNVIKFSACPVLLVPPSRQMTAFNRVLVPVRPISGALNFYPTLSEFLPAKAALDVLGLSYQKAEANTGVLDKIVTEIDALMQPSVKAKTSWGTQASLPDAVLLHTRQTKPDLLVVTSLLDAVSKQNYIGPHAQKIIQQATVPVLSLKKADVFCFA